MEAILGGEWRELEGGRCFVVETRIDTSTAFGRMRVADIAERLDEASSDAPMIAGGAPARPPFLFIDLETTGLMGGAGTYAFLVGCGEFVADGAFVTRQFVLTRFADERPLLGAVRAELERAGALVSFNGKSFDAPVLETRYLFHRLDWVGGMRPHLDILHPARRFWGGGGLGRASAGEDEGFSRPMAPGCSLLALEEQILGTRRTGDVPGFEIPARYFRFVRSGDARPLAAVLEHNRLDLLSLAGLTTRLLHLVRAGADAARDAHEALALGAIYSRAGLDGRACDAYTRAAAMCHVRRHTADTAARTRDPIVKIVALRALALLCRRARRFGDAAGYWQQVLEVDGCPGRVAREATEALAIHHEHRVRDLGLAKSFALRSLEGGRDSAWATAVRHRLARIDRKMQTIALPLAFPSWPSPPSSDSPTSGRRTSS